MMNSNPNNYFIFRQRIDQSTTIEEVVGLIQEIDTLRASEETASDAYDLLAVAFQALANLTHENMIEGERLIFDYLLPYLFYDMDAPVKILSAINRLRECLIEWYEQYPEPESSALRGRILDQLLLKLRSMPLLSACWIISDIGYRRQDIVHQLWRIAEQYDNDLGDTALATLTALGVPSGEKERLLTAVHERVPKRLTLPLIAALHRLADPSSLSPVLHSWLQNDTEQQNIAHRSLALRILIDIADASNLEEVQDQVWHAIVDLYQRQPEKFAFDIFLGGDIAPGCDSTHVVPTLLQWIGSEQGDSEATADHRRLLNLRLGDCLRPRQLEGWKIEPDPSTISVLRQDACLDTRFEGHATTHEMLIKEAAWQTLMCIGDGQILNWFKDAVSGETNRYLRGQMCDLFACFRLNPLPADIIHWIVEPFEANLPADSAEFVARLSAIRVARSSVSREGFEALLACGLSVNGENLRESVEVLEDVALALARSGDTVVVNQLVDTVVEHSESRRRSAAGSALGPLTAEGLLGKQDVERLAKTLLERDDRDPFEQSTIVASLGNLSKQEFPKELLLPFRQWAKERNDWLGIQSLFALAKHDDFLQHEELVAKAGLQHVGESRFTFPLLPHVRYAPWVTQLIGLLYTLYPEELLPAVVSIVEGLNWGLVVPIIWGMYKIHEQNTQSPLPKEIAEAFASRIQKRQRQTSAEPDIFHTLAELMPEKLVQESWDNLWNDWLPDARTALAESLGEAVYITSEAQAKAIALLRLLTADGQYAVRRAAYRSLANQSPSTLPHENYANAPLKHGRGCRWIPKQALKFINSSLLILSAQFGI